MSPRISRNIWRGRPLLAERLRRAARVFGRLSGVAARREAPADGGANNGMFPKSLPARHERFLTTAIQTLSRDARFVGIAAGGSFITDTMDEFSDLDLVLVVEPAAYPAILAERSQVAASLGPLLAAFTGEHVGEPRLLICLYDEAHPLHVDLKFVALADVSARVEDPVVLWERDAALTNALRERSARYPGPDGQWIEDRFWVWVHYAAAKIGRGELFDAIDMLTFLRGSVLGPLALARAGARPSGVRRVEQLPGADLALLTETVAAAVSAIECVRALRASVAAYRVLRTNGATLVPRTEAERASLAYLDHVQAQTSRR